MLQCAIQYHVTHIEEESYTCFCNVLESVEFSPNCLQVMIRTNKTATSVESIVFLISSLTCVLLRLAIQSFAACMGSLC